jgi:hypothetical protein
MLREQRERREKKERENEIKNTKSSSILTTRLQNMDPTSSNSNYQEINDLDIPYSQNENAVWKDNTGCSWKSSSSTRFTSSLDRNLNASGIIDRIQNVQNAIHDATRDATHDVEEDDVEEEPPLGITLPFQMNLID